MEKNTVALFWELNQSDKSTQKMACTIMAPLANIKYNCKWVTTSEKDADIIIERQIANKQLSLKAWATAINSVKAVINYFKEKWIEIKYDKFKSNDVTRLNYWLDLWYMVNILIQVDKDFYTDAHDWKINETNYLNFNDWKKFWHSTNIFKWKWRFTEGWEGLPDANKIAIYDNYAFRKNKKAWLYWDIDLIKLQTISQPFYYVFYL